MGRLNKGILWTALLALLLALAPSCGGMEEDGAAVTDEAMSDESDIETAEQALTGYACPSGYVKYAPCGSRWPCYKCVGFRHYIYNPTCKIVGGSYSYGPNSAGFCTVGITGFSHTNSCSAVYVSGTWKWYCCRTSGSCYYKSM